MSAFRRPRLSFSTRPHQEGMALEGAQPAWFRLLLGCLAIATCASSAGAQVVESVGTRALGMGGAFVAVADDASAIYWNPAGLASGAFASLVVDVARIANGDADEASLDESRARRSGTLIGLGTPPIGLGYYRVRVDTAGPGRPVGLPVVGGPVAVREIVTLVTDHFAATLVQSLADGVHVGASLKAVRGRAFADTWSLAAGETVADTWEAAGDLSGGQTKFDVDAGVMIDRGRWRAGLVGRNLTSPEFQGTSGRAVRLERQGRAGLAILPLDRLVIAVDADLTTTDGLDGPRRAVAGGVEYWTSAARALAFRAGVRAHTAGDSRPAASFGLSYAVRSLTYLDGQATIGGRLADRGFSVSARLLY